MSENLEKNIELDFVAEFMTDSEIEEVAKIQQEVLKSYVEHKDTMPLYKWLVFELHKQLPELSKDEIIEFSKEMLSSLRITEEEKAKLEKALEQGQGRDSWLKRRLKQITEKLTEKEQREFLETIDYTLNEENQKNVQLFESLASNTANQNNENNLNDKVISHSEHNEENRLRDNANKATSYVSLDGVKQNYNNIDNALKTATSNMADAVTTNSGNVNMGANLDGFIAEHHHANTYNIDAAVKGVKNKAEVLMPKQGETFGKNSVDIVIRNGSGKNIQRIQAKFGKDADSTIKYVREGNYRTQRILTPKGQAETVQGTLNRKVSDTISAGGASSTPLSKAEAKAMQETVQSGGKITYDYSNISNSALMSNIGNQAFAASVNGAVAGVGVNTALKLIQGENIEVEDVIQVALVSGADTGVKAATACSMKVASERGLISALPKGTPAGTFANIAFVAIENIKVIGKVLSGELTLREGFDKMCDTTAAAVVGISVSTKFATIGMVLGGVFGPIGVVVGGIVGGVVGYMAGSAIGEAASKVVRGVANVAVSVGKAVVNVGATIVGGIGNFVSSSVSFLTGGGCYITTAVCEFYGKPDDCYELIQFRKFRDEWLALQPDGKLIIKDYYEVAPKIVENINSSNTELERKEIFEYINNNYLRKCLYCIENNELEECKVLYIQMVEYLEDKYLVCN